MAFVMITKVQAGAIQAAAIAAAVAAMPQQILDAVNAAAAAGRTSIVFPYFPATSAQADAFIAGTLIGAGWTGSVNNNIATPGNFTITIS